MSLFKLPAILLLLSLGITQVRGQDAVFSDTEYTYHIAQTQVFRAEQDLKFKNEEKSPLVLASRSW